MKVLVLWEDPREQEEAENLANVLANLAPQLATAKVDKQGGVEIVHSATVVIPNVNVRAMSLRDAPPATPEHAEYVAALERSVFKAPVPQVKPEPLHTPQFAEVRMCEYMSCRAVVQAYADTKAEIDQHFSSVGWVGAYCPKHRHLRLGSVRPADRFR